MGLYNREAIDERIGTIETSKSTLSPSVIERNPLIFLTVILDIYIWIQFYIWQMITQL